MTVSSSRSHFGPSVQTEGAWRSHGSSRGSDRGQLSATKTATKSQFTFTTKGWTLKRSRYSSGRRLSFTSRLGDERLLSLSEVQKGRSLDWRRFQRKRKPFLSKQYVLSTLLIVATLAATGSRALPRIGQDWPVFKTGLQPALLWSRRPFQVSTRAEPDRQDTSGGIHSDKRVDITVIAPLKELSTLGNATWGEVLSHMALRLSWTDSSFHLVALDMDDVTRDSSQMNRNKEKLHGKNDIVVVIGAQDSPAVEAVVPIMDQSENAVALDSSKELDSSFRIAKTALQSSVVALVKSLPDPLVSAVGKFIPIVGKASQAHKVKELVAALYSRRTSDDLLYSFLVLINTGVQTVPAVANDTRRADAGFPAVVCMLSNCFQEITSCFQDPTCRKALDCLNGCSFNDQVCSYLCIASYESPALQAFSLCILQKHHCLGLSADIPQVPVIEPLAEFRGRPMTHEVAEGMFVGWFDKSPRGSLLPDPSRAEPFSWRVFAGKNAAYDHFPCQFQLFYPGKGKAFWYQPIFQVETLSGEKVWRERLYRVKRGETPGTFHLSVLDNGVTSNEFWRVLDCDDNLEWCAWYYSGAASAAGLSYTGAIFASRTGSWPTDAAAKQRIERALERAHIKIWELSSVKNNGCEAAPLVPLRVSTSS